MKMIVFPKAKINLGLRITGRRPDGYHDIETIFYPVGLRDALEFVTPAKPIIEDYLTVTGISIESDNEENLIIKTVRKLHEKYSFPHLHIHLHKAIPIGAGLGGGSSDAACFLKKVNQCFKLSISDQELKKIALELGSDCPYFINSTPSFAIGRGEILKPVRDVLNGYYLFLLNPGVGISTREAYQNCNPEKPSSSLFELIDNPVHEWKDRVINDFEEFAFEKYPVISNIKDELYSSGAVFSLMSGSGSSVYGVFYEKKAIPAKLKDFVIWEGEL
jgi:4-diphosphocytidyl-2-C-methyl-D-erythritol kinase